MSHLNIVNAASLDFVILQAFNRNKVATRRKRTTFQLRATLHFGQKAPAKRQLTHKVLLRIFHSLTSFSFF